MAPHTAVIELGYQNQVIGTAQAGTTQSQVPQAFLRLGVAPRLEVDVIGPNYEATRKYSTEAPTTLTNGVADAGVGAKYELPPGERWTVGFDGLYTGPNGSKFLTAGNSSLTGNVDASFSLSPATSVGTTIAVTTTGGYVQQVHQRYGLITPSVVFTTQARNFYQFYGEYGFVSKTAPNQPGRAFTDFGVQKLLGSRTEVDLEYGYAFSGVSSQRFNYVGGGIVLEIR